MPAPGLADGSFGTPRGRIVTMLHDEREGVKPPAGSV